MGLLARSLLARDALAILIILAILMILVGELYALDVFFSGRTWLPRAARVGIYILFAILASGGGSFLLTPWPSRFIESPGEYGPIQAILLLGLGIAYLIVIVLLSILIARWTFATPAQEANPASFWARARWAARHLPLTAFPRVGASLLALGILILGIACWLAL
ncbi:MAG TPA: hypothetical protein VFU69_16850 [Ktedonobacterales bacterium]|nr:hypothetical protein [Ktedonobacterales bacterium]